MLYDNQKRLLKHYHQVDNHPQVLLAENIYNELGQLAQKKVGGENGVFAQEIDYRYNIRGWLSGINVDENGNFQTDKLFNYKITYNDPLTDLSSTTPMDGRQIKEKYNGNIASVTWQTSNPTKDEAAQFRYGYVYDGLNRLLAGFYFRKTGTQFSFTGEHNELLDYDTNGNITRLQRYAYKAYGATAPNKIDSLTYTYFGNKVISITDHTQNSLGYEGGGQTITYDDNGNMTAMPDKGISSIEYNFLNLPNQINQNGNKSTDVYRADGVKLSKSFTLNNGMGSNVNTTEYLDGFHYSYSAAIGFGRALQETDDTTTKVRSAGHEEAISFDEGLVASMQKELSFFPTAEGFYDYKNNEYIYQYKDHLGNVRVSFVKNSAGVLCVRATNDYYPFGMNHLISGSLGTGVYNLVATPYNYKYNGKELQETGMYDYGWRNYAPDIARWITPDPLIKDHDFIFNPNEVDEDDDDELENAIATTLGNGGGIFNPDNLNPYSYGYNNPAKFDDPDGRCPTCIVGALVGGLTDYGMQGAANYLDPTVKNKWTDNISVSSIVLSAAEGALTQGGSAIRKAAIKTTVMVAKNTVEVNTTGGAKVETNVRNITKNTLVDAAAGGAAKKIGGLAKTAKLDKVANKVNLNSNTKAKNFVQKTTGLSSKISSNVAKKVDVKGISKQLSNGIKNSTNKAVENTVNAAAKNQVDKLKDKTNE